MSKKLVEIAALNKFGICPMCNAQVMLLKSEYSAYRLSESGWITSQTDSKTEFKIVCPECGFVYDVEVTPYGLSAKGAKIEEDIEPRKPILDNPIGKLVNG
ncbi:MAG: hypothetical protein IJ193_00750 [Bacilli bacterium]|nr:hypothetical protein [Bacilli bacterium]